MKWEDEKNFEQEQKNSGGRELFLSLESDEVIPERMMDDIGEKAEEDQPSGENH
jgi:hypothetical protein